MQPFDEPPSGTSGRQIAYDARRRRYLECLAKRAFLKSGPFDRWNDGDGRRRARPRDPEPEWACATRSRSWDSARLDPGLELVTLDLDKMTDERRNAVQREWLLSDSRETALGRALLVRAHPEREDELFGWERAGVDPDAYWTAKIHSVHMDLPARDRGLRRQRNPADHVPARRHARSTSRTRRSPGATRSSCSGPGTSRPARPRRLRASFTNFKYWFDDPFRCDEFSGEAKRIRSKKDLNGHEDMEPGQDMTYWSENHRILFAAAEYLAGQFWPDEMFISQRTNRKEGPSGPPRPGRHDRRAAHGARASPRRCAG